MKRRANHISELLLAKKEKFITDWKSQVEDALPATVKAEYGFSNDDFEELFTAYLTDGIPQGTLSLQSQVIAIIKEKINLGFPLSMIGIINSYFMATARSLIRSVYPDSFDARMEYLENLSQRVLHNEIALSQYFEEYVRDLNRQLKEKNDALERRHLTLREFIDCATRELQSPLWSILGFTAKLQRKYYSLLEDDGKHCLNRISANVAEMHQLLTDMISMLLIEDDTFRRQELSLPELIEQAAEKVQLEIDKNFQVTHETEGMRLTGDPVHLSTLFFHLFKNAAQYAREGKSGKVHIRTREDESFHLYVEDDGIGIEPAYRELVFTPLERLKEKKVEGSGLGLTFIRKIAAGHKGTVTLEDSRFGGIAVHLVFPLAMISPKRYNFSQY